MQRKVVRVGNALGVTLPVEVLARYGLRVGETVEVTAADDHIEIAPRRTVSEMLKAWRPIGAKVKAEDLTRGIREDRDSR